MRRTLCAVFGLVAAALLAYALVRCCRVQHQIRDAADTLAALETQAELLRRENASLARRIERSKDADAVADAAREALGLVLPEDRIYVVEDGH